MKITATLKKIAGLLYGNILTLALFIAVLSIFLISLSSARESGQNESEKIARESILRAVMSCYALEGAYPPTYEYLKENYAIAIDEKRYVVGYEIFASNIMPQISVTKR